MKIYLNTAHKRLQLENKNFNNSLLEICRVYNIPYQSVTFYGYKEGEDESNRVAPIIGIHKKLVDLQKNGVDKLIIQVDRNINYAELMEREKFIYECDNESSEYTFTFNKDENNLAFGHRHLNPVSCMDIVSQYIDEFFELVETNPDDKFIVGISGGGDSNTLLKGMLQSGRVNKDQLLPTIILGTDTWNKGLNRARFICKESGIALNEIPSSEVCRVLNKRGDDWTAGFTEVFSSKELELIGTLIIRAVLKNEVLKHQAQHMVTGLNLEDILSECLLQNMMGELPLPFPQRIIDNVSLLFPLYKVPKKILDGCYPNLSKQNYDERITDTLKGRTNAYVTCQHLQSSLPGIEFDLLEGYRRLSAINKNPFYYDEDIKFSLLNPITTELKQRWFHYLLY